MENKNQWLKILVLLLVSFTFLVTLVEAKSLSNAYLNITIPQECLDVHSFMPRTWCEFKIGNLGNSTIKLTMEMVNSQVPFASDIEVENTRCGSCYVGNSSYVENCTACGNVNYWEKFTRTTLVANKKYKHNETQQNPNTEKNFRATMTFPQEFGFSEWNITAIDEYTNNSLVFHPNMTYENASILEDDFADNDINKTLWYYSVNGGTVDETGGDLRLAQSGSSIANLYAFLRYDFMTSPSQNYSINFTLVDFDAVQSAINMTLYIFNETYGWPQNSSTDCSAIATNAYAFSLENWGQDDNTANQNVKINMTFSNNSNNWKIETFKVDTGVTRTHTTQLQRFNQSQELYLGWCLWADATATNAAMNIGQFNLSSTSQSNVTNIAPLILNISRMPNTAVYGGSYNFTAIVFDLDAQNMSYVNHTFLFANGTRKETNMTLMYAINSSANNYTMPYLINLTTLASIGNNYYWINASDGTATVNSAITTMLIQNNPPSILNMTTLPNSLSYNSITNFSIVYNDLENEFVFSNLTLLLANNTKLIDNLNMSCIPFNSTARNCTSTKLFNINTGNESLGIHRWWVNVSDGFNITDSSIKQINITDNKPTILNFTTLPNKLNYNDIINFSITYNDIEGNLSSVNLTLLLANSTKIINNLNMSCNSINTTSWNCTSTKSIILSTGNESLGIHKYFVNSSDGINEPASDSSIQTINISDFIKPNLNIINPLNQSYGNNTALSFNIQWSDNVERNTLWWEFNNNGTNVTLTNNFTMNFSSGNYIAEFWVNDSSNNINYSNVSFTIVYDNINPSLILYLPLRGNTTECVTSGTAWSCNVSLEYKVNDTNIDKVWFMVKRSDDNTTSIPNITASTTKNWSMTLGNYTYYTLYLYTNDTSNNQNSTIATFKVSFQSQSSSSQSSSQPPSQPPIINPTDITTPTTYSSIDSGLDNLLSLCGVDCSESDLLTLQRELQEEGILIPLETLKEWYELKTTLPSVPATGESGAGGGADISKGEKEIGKPLIYINGTRSFAISTVNGARGYSIFMSIGSSRSLDWVLINSGVDIVNLNFSCSSQSQNYDVCKEFDIKFNKQSVALQPNLNLKEILRASMKAPRNINDGDKYYYSIVVEDDKGFKDSLSVEITISKLKGFLFTYIDKLKGFNTIEFSKIKEGVRDFQYPKAILYIVIPIIIAAVAGILVSIALPLIGTLVGVFGSLGLIVLFLAIF